MTVRFFEESGAPTVLLGRSVRRLLQAVIFASIVMIPLFVSRAGDEYFPLPKHLLLRAESIVLAAIVSIAAIAGALKLHPRLDVRRHGVVIIAIGAVVWTVIGTLVSRNPAISAASLMTVAGFALIALVTHAVITRRSLFPVALLLVPGLINAGVYLLQSRDIWNPVFPEAMGDKAYHTALLGNPNTVGVYLAPLALVAVVLAMVNRGVLRWLLAAGAAFIYLVAAINATATSLLALAAATATLVMVVLWRRSAALALGTAAAILLMIGVAMFTIPSMKLRYITATRIFSDSRALDQLLSHRLTAWRAATNMFLDRPLSGVGPGTYHYHYLSYRIAELDEHPHIRGLRIWNFGEAHNDHLEILAETGLPGYILFVAALILMASCTFRRLPDPQSATARFAQRFGLPFAVLVFTIAIAQFPLQVAATSTLYVYLAVVLVAWGYDKKDSARLEEDGDERVAQDPQVLQK